MTFNEIREEIEKLLAFWPGCPVAFDGLPVPPLVQAAQQNKEPWVRLTIQPGATVSRCKGSTPEVRRTGLIQVQVFTKPDAGSREAYTICDELTPLLQHKIIDKLETLALSVSRTGEQDGYYQLNASVPYRAEH